MRKREQKAARRQREEQQRKQQREQEEREREEQQRFVALSDREKVRLKLLSSTALISRISLEV